MTAPSIGKQSYECSTPVGHTGYTVSSRIEIYPLKLVYLSNAIVATATNIMTVSQGMQRLPGSPWVQFRHHNLHGCQSFSQPVSLFTSYDDICTT
jgi:hypothetical protein